MRTLSSTLLAAQKSSSRTPYIKVEVIDRVAGVNRLTWERLYSGGEPDFYHAVTMPGDSSLVRVRVDSGTFQLYRQRVVNPGPGSNFNSWTAVDTVSAVTGIALASRGATVLLFYTGADQRTIYFRESGNYGASFGSAASILTAGTTVGWLAAAINDSNVAALFYSVGGTVYVVKRTGGVWGAPSAWTNSASAITGLGCAYQGDWNLAVSGQDSAGNYKVWTCVYGDGYSRSPGVWSALTELTTSSVGSNVSFHCPFLDFSDVFRMFFVEKYTGSMAYSRPQWTHSMPTSDFISGLWREPVPFNLTSNYSTGITHSGSYTWLSTPSGVWRACLSPASIEVSGDTLELTLTSTPISGRAQIRLRNDDGRYSSLVPPIKEGAEILISPGYRTASGNEVSSGPAYWIHGWEHISRAGEASLVLYAEDGWGLLERWRARRQFTWAAGEKNVFQLLQCIFSRAGMEISPVSSSSPLVNLYPAFTIHPGESGAVAARRLLDMVPDVIFFRGACACLLDPLPGDPSVYGYGSSHAVLLGRYGSLSPDFNRVQVFGNGVLAEGFNWGDLEYVRDRLKQVHDLNLGNATRAQERADAELRRQEISSLSGEIVVPPNCGQELYDVIDITDERSGLDAAKRRVLGLDLRYSAKAARYEQRLLLGGV